MALFSVTTFVVFHFGLAARQLEGALAAGVLWVTLLFAAMLGANRLFVADVEGGALEGMLLAPFDRTALLVAKARRVPGVPGGRRTRRGAGVLPAAARALGGRRGAGPAGGPGPGQRRHRGDRHAGRGAGHATRSRDLLVPLLGLPLLLPVVIAAARATAPAVRRGGADGLPGRWMAVLGLYDLVFGLIDCAVFDFLLED